MAFWLPILAAIITTAATSAISGGMSKLFGGKQKTPKTEKPKPGAAPDTKAPFDLLRRQSDPMTMSFGNVLNPDYSASTSMLTGG